MDTLSNTHGYCEAGWCAPPKAATLVHAWIVLKYMLVVCEHKFTSTDSSPVCFPSLMSVTAILPRGAGQDPPGAAAFAPGGWCLQLPLQLVPCSKPSQGAQWAVMPQPTITWTSGQPKWVCGLLVLSQSSSKCYAGKCQASSFTLNSLWPV